MERMTLDDARVVEISEAWLDFLEKIHDDLPDNATALSLGQLFLYLLMEYEPPIVELVGVLEPVLNTYADYTNNTAYKEKMH